jgi:hypothetical protein
MPGEQPAFDIARSAGREVDQQGETFALVEWIIGMGAGRAADGQSSGAKPDRDGPHE